MADNKKYLEVFSDGTTDYIIRDKEAQAVIGEIETASVDTCMSIINELV